METNDEPDPVITFSGAHVFNPRHAGRHWKIAKANVDARRCPRCECDLYPSVEEMVRGAWIARPGDATPIWRPAGSRMSFCRCVPVCDTCAYSEGGGAHAARILLVRQNAIVCEHGTKHGVGLLRLLLSYTSPNQWPVDRPLVADAVRVVKESLPNIAQRSAMPASRLTLTDASGWLAPSDTAEIAALDESDDVSGESGDV